MHFVTRMTLLVCLCALAHSTSAADRPQPFEITQLTERLHVIHGGSGFGSHVGVCEGDESLLLIDTMNPNATERLAAAIRTLSDKPVRQVINTHAHRDHTGGNPYFAEHGATIIAHEGARYGNSLVHVYTAGGFSLAACDETITAVPLVAHTYDDLLIRFETSNVLFMGDTFANAYYPSGYARGRDSELATMALAESLSDEETVIVPGHGFIDDTHGLDRYQRLVDAWFDRLREMTKQGATFDAMLADQKLIDIGSEFLECIEPQFDVQPRFERFLRRTLSAERESPEAYRNAPPERFAGSYSTGSGAPITVIAQPGNLLMAQEGSFIEELVQIGPRDFHIRGSLGGTVRFDQAAERLEIRGEGIAIDATRTGVAED